MAICINKNSIEYQSLKQRAGIDELLLEVTCEEFLEEHNRYPYLDELPGSNSQPFLEKILKLDKHGTTNIDKILEQSGSNTIEEANINLNNIYRDLEVEIIPINKTAFVDISRRPNDTDLNIEELHDVDEVVHSQVLFLEKLSKLQKLYGIKINDTSDVDLSTDKWGDLMPKDRIVNGFVYDGEIYINVDRASVDTPIHEMMHLLIGSLRFSNPQLYSELIAYAESLPNYQSFVEKFQNRSRNDINEEIFISEISKHFAGMYSEFSKLPKSYLYEIDYHVKRMLDSMLHGGVSTKTINNHVLYRSSLKEVASLVNSTDLNNKFSGFFNQENSALHRKLNNIKEDLLKKGQLKEVCD